MSELNKILVVGAGVAGPAVCYWLKRFGFTPTLIEKAAKIRKGGQALDVRGTATHLARKMDIYSKICDMRTQITCGRYVDASGKILHEEDGETFGFRQGDEVEILRGDLVEILMQAIPEIPCTFDRSIASIEQTDETVRVSFQDGQVEHYDLVIGADGVYSSTRNKVFTPEDYELKKIGSYLSTFMIPNYLDLKRTELVCEQSDRLITINSDKDPALARVGFMFRTQKELKDQRDEKAQKQFLCDVFHNFGWEAPKLLELMPASEDFYFDNMTQIKMPAWTKGRVALVGDAGYCASPLSGQGNNLALVGAYILAGELKSAKGDYIQAFNRYNQLMRNFVLANQQFGIWVSESFLLADQASKEITEDRSNKILEMMAKVSNGIELPEYE